MSLDDARAPASRAPRRRVVRCGLASLVSLAFGLPAAPSLAETDPAKGWVARREAYFDPFGLAWNDGRWWATASLGVVAKNNLSSIVLLADPDFGKSYIAGLALGREFGAISDGLRLEWQAGAALVWGREDYVDLRFELGARWIRFPWNDHVFTTAALLLGPSYITSLSNYELKEGDASHFKNGLTIEITVAPPSRPDLALALRIHHRSSIFHLVPDAGTPSDFVTLGLKLRF